MVSGLCPFDTPDDCRANGEEREGKTPGEALRIGWIGCHVPPLKWQKDVRPFRLYLHQIASETITNGTWN
jgi:hypothetical protein